MEEVVNVDAAHLDVLAIRTLTHQHALAGRGFGRTVKLRVGRALAVWHRQASIRRRLLLVTLRGPLVLGRVSLRRSRVARGLAKLVDGASSSIAELGLDGLGGALMRQVLRVLRSTVIVGFRLDPRFRLDGRHGKRQAITSRGGLSAVVGVA